VGSLSPTRGFDLAGDGNVWYQYAVELQRAKTLGSKTPQGSNFYPPDSKERAAFDAWNSSIFGQPAFLVKSF
jgi:hypothetical protein